MSRSRNPADEIAVPRRTCWPRQTERPSGVRLQAYCRVKSLRFKASPSAAIVRARLEEVLDWTIASDIWAENAFRSAKNEAMLAPRGLASRTIARSRRVDLYQANAGRPGAEIDSSRRSRARLRASVGLDGALSRCRTKSTKSLRLVSIQAVATAARHVFIAQHESFDAFGLIGGGAGR